MDSGIFKEGWSKSYQLKVIVWINKKISGEAYTTEKNLNNFFRLKKPNFLAALLKMQRYLSILKSAEKTDKCTRTCNMYQNEILLCLQKVHKQIHHLPQYAVAGLLPLPHIVHMQVMRNLTWMRIPADLPSSFPADKDFSGKNLDPLTLVKNIWKSNYQTLYLFIWTCSKHIRKLKSYNIK